MPSIADALDSIFLRPLDYVHPVRFGICSLFDTPDAKAVLNRVVSERLGGIFPRDGYVDLSPKARLWIRHWSLLPVIAGLVGAQLQWAHLAQGASLQQLSGAQRAFARVVCSPRAGGPLKNNVTVEQWVQATGLNALMAWSVEIPEVLITRLLLQFSPQVVDLQQHMPAQNLNATLFFLAVQHARIHQNAD
ncbi:hypothetical protein [Pseudomonas fluorescens]|uniref:Type III secretion apparatus protein OrgA/MxiK n=1 Tax=Pseudomonas fluorescens TaxID=294 RepID=A0A5E7GCZ4_PSEFL|nr:hypothetical protein [Pseudomonas fluorescens]VVO48752.1 hypothetical protein PS880_00187 [Pseudomonas fluorescens]